MCVLETQAAYVQELAGWLGTGESSVEPETQFKLSWDWLPVLITVSLKPVWLVGWMSWGNVLSMSGLGYVVLPRRNVEAEARVLLPAPAERDERP